MRSWSKIRYSGFLLKKHYCLLSSIFLSLLVSAEDHQVKPHAVDSGTKPVAEKMPCTEWLPIGKTRSIQHSGSVKDAAFSPDGKYIVSISLDTAFITDVSTGKTVGSFKHGKLMNSIDISPNSRYALSTNDDNSVRINVIPSGKEVFNMPDFARDVGWNRYVRLTYKAKFSPDGKKIVVVGNDQKARLYDIATKRELASLSHGVSSVTQVEFSRDGKCLASGGDDENINIFDIASGKVTQINPGSDIRSLAFSPNGQYLVTGTWGKSIKVIEVSTGKIISSTDTQSYPVGNEFSDDGKELFSITEEALKILEFPSGKTLRTIPLKNSPYVASFSPDKKLMTSAGHDARVHVEDLESGKTILKIPHSSGVDIPKFSGNGKHLLSNSRDESAKYAEQNYLCKEKVPFTFVLPEGETNQAKNAAFSEDLCRLDQISGEQWNKYVDSSMWSGNVSPEDTYKLLYRFQKPGGFDPARDTNTLLTILESNIVQKEPTMVAGIMENVLLSSNQLFNSIMENYPQLVKTLKTAKLSSTEKICRNASNEKEISEFAVKEVTEQLRILSLRRSTKENPFEKSIQDLDTFLPLKRIFKNLQPNEKEAMKYRMATYLQEAAADSRELHSIFSSKLYYFSENAVSNRFFDEQKTFADITFVRERNYLQPYILGTHAIDGKESSLSRFGFYVNKLKAVPIEDLKKGSAQRIEFDTKWQHEGATYESKFPISLGSSKALVNREASPPYEQLKSDGALEGIIVAGSNMGVSLSNSVMKQYRDYFEGRGFVFSSSQYINDVPNFVSKKISSGQAGYFLKEAHSDGDEKNIFRMDAQSKLIVGVRKDASGKVVEKINLFYPPDTAGSTRLVSNKEFGDWVYNRPNPFVYFNTSCWSSKKAINEIEAAATSKLINIASTTTVNTFANSPENTEYQMLESFRAGKNYSDIREAMKKSKLYYAGRSDQLMFPDEDRYFKEIGDLIQYPLVYEPVVLKDGKVSNIDER